MHSKVIIASLVCVLAASFNAGNGINARFINNKTKAIASETACHAPSNDWAYFTVEDEIVDSGNTIVAVLNSESDSSFFILEKTPSLSVAFDQNDGRTVLIESPTQSGEYFVSFEREGNEIGTIYIYSDGSHNCVSPLSMNDAKSIYFFKYVASFEERMLLSHSEEVEIVPIIGPKLSGLSSGVNLTGLNLPISGGTSTATKFSAQKHYGEFVYGSDNDIITNASFVKNTGTNSNGVDITVHANWYDQNNQPHPLKGVEVELSCAGNALPTEIYHPTGGTPCTNSNGEYVHHLNNLLASKFIASLVEITIYSSNGATNVIDNKGLSYPYCYTKPGTLNNTKLSAYKTIDFYVNVYPGRSDRSSAYGICEAQLLPCSYCNHFTDGVEQIDTLYPSSYSAYFCDDTPLIKIQKEDASSWDVLNHEYGHYICDSLNLCRLFPNEMPHGINENLVDKFGLHDGLELAFSEGLATYIGIASQMYNGTMNSVFGAGDEKYQDTFRNTVVDYNLAASGTTGSIAGGEGVESRITGLLLKMLDDENRQGDNVRLGDREMWDILTENPDGNRSVCRFLETAVDYSSYVEDEIKALAQLEGVSLKSDVDKWTIMIYMAGNTLEYEPRYGILGFASDDIAEMLSVDGQSEYVNIIIETGGSYHWGNELIPYQRIGRFHIANGELVSEEDSYLLEDDNMGEQSTFESFLRWGLEEYPAEKTGVVMWNHGGALDGVCFDRRHQDDGILNSEMFAACENVFDEYNIQKLEFIGYDACLMQVQDIAEFNSHRFNYMIASPEVETGDGWSYDAWLPALYADMPTTTILEAIADGLMDVEVSPYDPWLPMISVLDLSKMSTYYTKFEALFSDMYEMAIGRINEFEIAAMASFRFYNGFYWNHYQTVDCADFLCNLKGFDCFSNYYSRIDEILAALYDMVIYNPPTPFGTFTCGLAMHVACENQYFAKYYPEEETHFTGWRNIWMYEKPTLEPVPDPIVY